MAERDPGGRGDEPRDDDQFDEQSKEDATAPIPPLEWAIAGVGLCLVVACLAYLVHRGLTHDPTPPALAVRVESVAAAGDAHHVRFRVENRGGEPAAQIVVRGELIGGGERGSEPERHEVTIDLVPADATRSGGLYFRGDPARGRLVVQAVGYQDP
jgi:uncharacterized protein (TIGR02588 family)